MCTLTFINNTSGISITSNRDEHIDRGNSKFPVTKEINHQKIIFPQDPQAGGTWLATSSNQRVIVLLNGAFLKHKHQPPYRLSRGIVVLDAFKYNSLKDFQQSYLLQDIEPFTLVHFDLKNQIIEEVRWNEKTASYATYNFQEPHIWSSATLYSPETRQQREDWFNQWLNKPNLNASEMMDFHHFGGGKTNSSTIKMERNAVLKTVSISQIHSTAQETSFMHHVLLTDTELTTIV